MWYLGSLCLGLSNAALMFAMIMRPSAHSSQRLLLGAGGLFVFSFLLLIWSFITGDFDILYVASNSNSKLPLFYRISAAWGSHEGSFLLWVVMLSIWGIVYIRPKRSAIDQQAAWYFFAISSLFANYIFFFSNPFDPIIPAGPVDGQDLNPLLQDPGMIIHPPMLYAGYVGFIIPMVYLLAICDMRAHKDFHWPQMASMFRNALAFLTAGICLGSWWAYRELGWGGFWFWDPVENASLMPWLAGMLVLHLMKARKPDATASVMLYFAILSAFLLSVLGTFMVRSGILVSVHTFASDPQRGIVLLAILAVLLIGGGLKILQNAPPKHENAANIRHQLSLISAMLLASSLLVVVLGTLLPLFYEVIFSQSITIGSAYFNQMHVVIVALALAAYNSFMVLIAPQKKLTWQRFVGEFVGLVGVLYLYPPQTLWEFIIPCILVLAIGAQWHSYLTLRARLVHTGFIVVLLGVFWHAQYARSYNFALQLGESIKLAHMDWKLENIYQGAGDNYQAYAFELTSQLNGKPIQLFPERRHYPVRDMTNAKSDIQQVGLTDVYVNVGQNMQDDQFAFRLYIKPGVILLWIGGIIMVIGLLIPRRRLNEQK